jgi:hypothetical protein
MGISVDAWRIRIGSFALHYIKNFNSTNLSKSNNTASNISKNCNVKGVPLQFLSIMKYSLYVVFILLLIAGVETNPGPFDNETQDYLTAFESRMALLIKSSKEETLKAINNVRTDVNNLTVKVAGIKDDLTLANKRITDLETKNNELNGKIDELENHIRKSNILIFGLIEADGGNEPIDDFLTFTKSQLGIDIDPNVVDNVYRMGKVYGKRPLFVSFNKLSVKNNVMKNAFKLKGSKISISEDLTKTARAKKKYILACANKARAAGHVVKIKNDNLIVGSTSFNYQQLQAPAWLQTLGVNTNENIPENSLKRPRVISPQASSSSNDQTLNNTILGNEMPPPSNAEEGEGFRSRSSSRSKKPKKHFTQE